MGSNLADDLRRRALEMGILAGRKQDAGDAVLAAFYEGKVEAYLIAAELVGRVECVEGSALADPDDASPDACWDREVVR